MPWTLLAQLIVFTAGSVLYLFLLVLLAGLRRPRLVESLFFLCLISLFICYAGVLLQLNAEVHYGAVPPSTEDFADLLEGVGLAVFPALLIHAHTELWSKLSGGLKLVWRLFLLTLAYGGLVAGPVAFGLQQGGFYWLRNPFPTYRLPFWGAWVSVATFLAAATHMRAASRVVDAAQIQLHRILAIVFASLSVVGILFSLFPVSNRLGLLGGAVQGSYSLFFWLLVLPGAVMTYFVIRRRLVAFGVQRHLVVTVTIAFLGLLYLTLARRLSVWLEPYLPPEATVSILLFVLVIFFEPLQRRVGNLLQHTFRREAEKLQRLTAEIQQVARAGELEEVVPFAEARIAETLALPGVRIIVREGPDRPATTSGPVQRFALREGANEIGVLEAHYYGQTLSGETHAALEYLAEQLPAALDLCRLIQEKLRLERELAERQRFALLGQMAASVSHNLRNPLGSMKTLLQVQLESPELPVAAREDIRRVVAEIDQLSAKLTQLLQYSKPSVRGVASETAQVNVTAHLRQAVALLTPEAERRHIKLQEGPTDAELTAHGTDEAVHDIVSNLLVNALEAVAEGGTVRVAATARDRVVVLDIADDGPGIPADVRGRIFEPFFTTKPRGTGLGLAIVLKRLDEIGGRIECESPLKNGRGTLFRVSLPRAQAPEV